MTLSTQMAEPRTHAGVLHDSPESLENPPHVHAGVHVKIKDHRDFHDMACCGLQDAGTRVTEAKRQADDAQDQIRAHREHSRRVSAEYGTAEEDPNECVECVGQLIRDTAGATHALSCGSTDRDSNEVRYFREALDMIGDFLRWGARREVAEIILVERQT